MSCHLWHDMTWHDGQRPHHIHLHILAYNLNFINNWHLLPYLMVNTLSTHQFNMSCINLCVLAWFILWYHFIISEDMHMFSWTKSPKCVGTSGAMNYHLDQQIPNPHWNWHCSIIMTMIPSCSTLLCKDTIF